MIREFIIGGLTVSGISYASNQINNTLLAGIIASVPIGMPSSIFVNDKDVLSYAWNLLVMTFILLLSTFSNWYMLSQLKYNKYSSVLISMGIWIIGGICYYYYSSS